MPSENCVFLMRRALEDVEFRVERAFASGMIDPFVVLTDLHNPLGYRLATAGNTPNVISYIDQQLADAAGDQVVWRSYVGDGDIVIEWLRENIAGLALAAECNEEQLLVEDGRQALENLLDALARRPVENHFHVGVIVSDEGQMEITSVVARRPIPQPPSNIC